MSKALVCYCFFVFHRIGEYISLDLFYHESTLLIFFYISSFLSVLFFASVFFCFYLLAPEEDSFCRKRSCAIVSSCFVALVSTFPQISSIMK